MNLVFDTDILSTFGKIRRLDLLKKLFPNVRFFVPSSVYNELFKARERGYEFVDYVIESGILEVIPLNKEELEFLGRLREERNLWVWVNWKGYPSANTGNTFLLPMI